jgi:SAM-dependent methyltransferase
MNTPDLIEEPLREVIKSIPSGFAHPYKAVRFAFRYAHRKLVVRPNRLLREWWFDRVNNVSTRGEVAVSDLAPVAEGSLEHASKYQGCPLPHLKWALATFTSNYPDTRHLLDVGCGEGRACFYAARYFPKVTGVDISPKLVARANTNLQTFHNRSHCQMSFSVQDATSLELPDEQCVVFLCNPFDDVVMRKFLAGNLKRFSRYGSRVIYVNDLHASVFADLGFKVLHTERKYYTAMYSL